MESCKCARKANFSSAECSLILQLAEENLETIREKFSSTLTNKKNKPFGSQ
jgi:cobalamin biosynthesis protein CbiG